MKKSILLFATMILAGNTAASASSDITIKYNGEKISFNEPPVIVNDKTLVQLRPIAEALGLDIDFLSKKGSVILSDNTTTVVFTENSDKITINDDEKTMDVPVVVRNDYTFVPVRTLAEPFADEITFDGITKTVSILKIDDESETSEKEEEPKEISTGSGEYDFTYFYQSQPELELENNGRGYCWVCAYAMLMSDVKGELITPADVASINVQRGYKGNFMSGHETLVSEFGYTLVPALSEESIYYAGFNTKNKGETTLKITSDEDAASAIREALDNHPKGVIVRFEGYPHSMTAVEYDDENIFFNDPGLKDGEHITFDKTCLKNFKLSDISYIQAIEIKE